MKNAKQVVTLIAAISGMSSAYATDTGLSLTVGSTGIGLHLSTPVRDSVNFRVGFNYLRNHTFSTSTNYLDYDLTLKIRTVDVLADWFPMNNAFHITAGLIYNSNRIDGIGVPKIGGKFNINGETIDVRQFGQIDGRIDFRSTAPYLGIGWGNPVAADRGWRFAADIGVMFQDSPKVKLGTSGCSLPGPACGIIDYALMPLIQTETRRLNRNLRHYRSYPVVRIGVAYKF